jgi:hypothetical protein
MQTNQLGKQLRGAFHIYAYPSQRNLISLVEEQSCPHYKTLLVYFTNRV